MGMNEFLNIFKTTKPVITVLHGRGNSDREVLENAKREADIFLSNGIDALLVENYFCSPEQAEMVLDYVSTLKAQVPIGSNLLGNDSLNFTLARKYDCDFMQLDSVSGHLTPEEDVNFRATLSKRRSTTRAKLIGGVRFKYQPYKSGRTLAEDIEIAKSRCDAVAVTGDLTGQETSIVKIKEFHLLLGDFPLVIAAGLTPENLSAQLKLGDACIVGSFFKENHDVAGAVNVKFVQEFMEQIQIVREKQ